MRHRSPALILGIALVCAACGGSRDDDRGPVITLSGSPTLLLPPTITPAPDLIVAADPKLEGFASWPLAFRYTPGSYAGLACTITISRAGTEIASLPGMLADRRCTANWSGRDASGGWLSLGAVDVSARLADPGGTTLAETSTQVELVRLGFASLRVAPATPGTQAPLLYARVGGRRGSYWEIPLDQPQWRIGPDSSGGGTTLDLASGDPRAVPEPWDDLGTPPADPGTADRINHTHHSLPSAFVSGAGLVLGVVFPDDVPAPTLTDIRVVPPEGFDAATEVTFAPGGSGNFTQLLADPAGVGRYDAIYSWRFEALTPTGDWVEIPGGVTTSHRYYRLAGMPSFRYTSVPHRAWVEVIDMLTGWVDGATADPDEVAAAVVEGVYFDMDLQYDRESGASAYTGYGSGWMGGTFALARFVDRLDGNIINCSDAASIVSTFSDMLGVDIRYHILTHRVDTGFDLNYIKAIGWPEFDETPFFGDRGAFRYHAVVGPADGSIYDATLELDGDGTPTAAPFTDLLAQGMDSLAYRVALSSEGPDVVVRYDEKMRIE